MRMPWGKYKDDPLEEVPLSYLAWVLEECNNIDHSLRRAISDEIVDRLDIVIPTRVEYVKQLPLEELKKVRNVRKTLAMQHHPDRGGSLDIMTGINIAIDEIESVLLGAS